VKNLAAFLADPGLHSCPTDR